MQTLKFNGSSTPRLDIYIREQVPHLSPGHLHKYWRQNKIKLNGKRQPLATRLAPGDEVRLYLPPNAGAAPALQVLYEDDALLAVNKPAGLLCLNESAPDAPNTLLAQARQYTGGGFLALCHRLDTGTSGVVLLAKTEDMLHWVTGLMREKQLSKTYLAVTVGHPQPAAATLGGWHTKDTASGIVRITKSKTPGAKPAQTQYQTLAASGRLALLRIQLITGRTHQIRAHMASIGTPLLGDSKYGNQQTNRALRCRYQCLCAQQVRFPAQVPPSFSTYEGLCIECEPPWFYNQMLDGTLWLD